MPLPEQLTDPVPLAILTLVLAVAVHYQRGLAWGEYRRIHGLKRRVFPILDDAEPFGFTMFVNDKGGRDDAEFLVSMDGDVRDVFDALRAGGASPHVLCSIKRRPVPPTTLDAETQLTAAHCVWVHDDGTQTEAYLFDAGELTDVYVHHETAVTDAEGHLTDGVSAADPKDVVRPALAEGDV